MSKSPPPNQELWLSLPRTLALSTADPRTAASATGTPRAPLSSQVLRCGGPAGAFSSLTPLFQKSCLRWTNQGTTENHSLVYIVTGVNASQLGLWQPKCQIWRLQKTKVSWHLAISRPTCLVLVSWTVTTWKQFTEIDYYSAENPVLWGRKSRNRGEGIWGCKSRRKKLTHAVNQIKGGKQINTPTIHRRIADSKVAMYKCGQIAIIILLEWGWRKHLGELEFPLIL